MHFSVSGCTLTPPSTHILYITHTYGVPLDREFYFEQNNLKKQVFTMNRHFLVSFSKHTHVNKLNFDPYIYTPWYTISKF